MKGIYTVLLLIGSNVLMTLAWYGHLKLQEIVAIDWCDCLLVVCGIFRVLLGGSSQPYRF